MKSFFNHTHNFVEPGSIFCEIHNMRSYILAIALLLASLAVFSQKALKQKIARQPYYKYCLPNKVIKDSVTFYLSENNSTTKLPLLIYIQGSGNNSLFNKTNDGKIYPTTGHMTWFDNSQSKIRILIVEKPGVHFLQISGENELFDRTFSLNTWSERIKSVIQYVTKNENIDTEKIMIVGHSEGGLVAAKVANKLANTISNVAILAGEGPSQLYSLYKLTEAGELFYTQNPDKQTRLDSLNKAWERIQEDPNSTIEKFWGLTYLRWFTFLKTSVMEQLHGYNGKILIVQGTNDKNVFPESANILYADLKSKGKNVTLDLVEGADHSFNFVNDMNRNGWSEVSKKCLAWFLN